MKKNLLIVLSILLLFFILAPGKTQAVEQFIKNEANPLTINYLSGYDSLLHTHIFKMNDSLIGVFTVKKQNGNYVLVLAKQTSSNEWTMQKEIWEDGQEISNPRVLFLENNHLRLFYTKLAEYYKIYSIDCDADFNCEGSPNLVLDKSENWEYKGVGSGFPYFKNGIYYLFYGGWGNIFQIGIATSEDGLHWTKCPNSPVISYGDGSFLFEKNGKFYLFYHAPAGEGIVVTESSDPLSCTMHWQQRNYILFPDKDYDQKHLISPSIVINGKNLDLYYSGRGQDLIWKFNLATSILPKENALYLIIPGFFASWNREAILHNHLTSIFDWKLPTFVEEYKGLKQSLINLGFIEDQDFMFFPYDWREAVDETTNKLDIFLQEKVWKDDPDKKVKIIGHSLGGLIGRIYLQKYPTRNIEKVVTVGTPHKGIAQVYEPLVTGDTPIENSFLWLIEKIMIFINKLEEESDRETITRVLPVLYDFVPTFNFLKKVDGQEINIDEMLLNNTTLRRYNNSLPDFFDKFTAIYGEKDARTPAGYLVEEPVLNSSGVFVEDPKPISPFFASGDYTVLSQSGKDERDPDYIQLPFDHNELIYKKEGIESVFKALNIDYDPSLIVEGSKTQISPSLVFMMQSPAEMEVVFADKVYQEEDGIIFIPGAETGQYILKVKGLDVGQYTVNVGEIGENNDSWRKIKGLISQDPPSSQVDSYTINFDRENIVTPTPTTTPIPEPEITITTIPSITPTPTGIIIAQSQSSITPTSTPSPSSTPTPTQAQQPTPTETVSNNTVEKLTDNEQGKVLGEKEMIVKDSPKAKTSSKKIIYFLLIIFIAIICLVFFVYKKYAKL